MALHVDAETQTRMNTPTGTDEAPVTIRTLGGLSVHFVGDIDHKTLFETAVASVRQKRVRSLEAPGDRERTKKPGVGEDPARFEEHW